MTTTALTAFYSQIAAAIFGYKQYPTKEEFMRVALDITKKFPFLESPIECGSKAVSRNLLSCIYLINWTTYLYIGCNC